MRQCRFIRPLLLRTPPDPTSFRPRDLRELLLPRQGSSPKLGETGIYDTIRFYTMSIADYLDEYFESDAGQGHARRQRHHRHARWACYSPGTAYVLLHHDMGDVDGNDGRLGLCARRHGRHRQGHRRRFQAHGGEICVRLRRCEQHRREERQRDRRGAGQRRRDLRRRRRLQPRPEAHVPRSAWTRRTSTPDFLQEGAEFQDPRLLRQAQHRPRRPAGFPGAAARTIRCCTATCISSTPSSGWSAPTTTGRTAPGRRIRTSTC